MVNESRPQETSLIDCFTMALDRERLGYAEEPFILQRGVMCRVGRMQFIPVVVPISPGLGIEP